VSKKELLNVAIVVDLEPGRPIARQTQAGVRVAEHRMTDRPATSIRVNRKQGPKFLHPASLHRAR
jgi:hypothetical protein